MWNKANLAVGIGMFVVFSILAFGGIKSPFGAMGKAFAGSKSSGRGGSGFFYYGGGK